MDQEEVAGADLYGLNAFFDDHAGMPLEEVVLRAGDQFAPMLDQFLAQNREKVKPLIEALGPLIPGDEPTAFIACATMLARTVQDQQRLAMIAACLLIELAKTKKGDPIDHVQAL